MTEQRLLDLLEKAIEYGEDLIAIEIIKCIGEIHKSNDTAWYPLYPSDPWYQTTTFPKLTWCGTSSGTKNEEPLTENECVQVENYSSELIEFSKRF